MTDSPTPQAIITELEKLVELWYPHMSISGALEKYPLLQQQFTKCAKLCHPEGIST